MRNESETDRQQQSSSNSSGGGKVEKQTMWWEMKAWPYIAAGHAQTEKESRLKNETKDSEISLETARRLQEIETTGHLPNGNKRINFSVMQWKGCAVRTAGVFAPISIYFVSISFELQRKKYERKKRENKTEKNERSGKTKWI